MNIKIIIPVLIIVIILIVVAIGVFIFYFNQEDKAFSEKENKFSIIETEDVSFEQEQSFKIGEAEFIIHPPDLENFEFGYFEAYSKGEKIYTSTPLYMIWDILAFEYEDNRYIIISDYSGGAHCCFEEYIFLLDDELKLIKTLALGETTILEDSLVMKNEKLYIKVFNDAFAYFYTPYVNSYFFIEYLEVKNDELVINNDDFKQSYLEEAVRCEDELAEQIETEVGDFENYSPLLVCITVNYILADQEDLAWQQFDLYSNKVDLNHYGGEVDLGQFKKELIELL